MKLYCLGISHRMASIEELSNLVLHEKNRLDFVNFLKQEFPSHVLLQTCNRMEIYLVCAENPYQILKQALCKALNLEFAEFDGRFYFKTDQEVVYHLLEVVSSLDSVILGESQIQAQIREVYQKARNEGRVCKILGRLFETALKTGKRVRTETSIGRGAVSVAQAAVELSFRFFADLKAVKALILGAGEMGTLCARHLIASGFQRPMVWNRSFERVQALAQVVEIEPREQASLEQSILEADLLIAAVNYEGFILKADRMAQLMAKRRYKTLFLIDIGLPRTLDPAIHDLPNAFVYDIDDLRQVVEKNQDSRQKQRSEVLNILEEEAKLFLQWIEEQQLVPLLTMLEEWKTHLIQAELKKTNPDLQKSLNLISSKLLHVSRRLIKEGFNGADRLKKLDRIVQESIKPESQDSSS